jgi:hypothetical protein
MLQYLLYFFAFIGVLSTTSFIVAAYLVRNERREIDQKDLDI